MTQATSINVNVLSHLERSRVETLSASGMAFSEAKVRAQGELVQLFGVEASQAASSEELDISGSSGADAALLAISLMVQAHRSVGEMSELLSTIGTELASDGMLDSDSAGRALVNAATLTDIAAVRQNLETRFESLGVDAAVGDFEGQVEAFLKESPYGFTSVIQFPESGSEGSYLLRMGAMEMAPGSYALAVNLPEGTSLRVHMRSTSGGLWYKNVFDDGGWGVRDYDAVMGQTFTATTLNPDMPLFLEGSLPLQ